MSHAATMCLAVLASTAIASADPADTRATPATWPTELTQRPLTLGDQLGELELDATRTTTVMSSTATAGFGAAFGATDRWTIDAQHREGENGVHATYGVVRSHAFELAPRVGVEAYDTDGQDLWWAIRAGVALEARAGRIAIVAMPSIAVGLGDGGASRASVSMPITVELQATHQLAPYLRTGIAGSDQDSGAPVQYFAESFTIPIGIGALLAVAPSCDLGVELAYPFAAGALTAPESQLGVFGRFRM